MTEYLLIKADFSWADEITCKCFAVYPKKDWEEYKAEVKAWFDEEQDEDDDREDWEPYKCITLGIGTNEDVEFESYEEWVGVFDEKVLTKEEAVTIMSLFKFNKAGGSYGTGDGIFEILAYT